MLVQGLGVAQWNLLKSGENCAELKKFPEKKTNLSRWIGFKERRAKTECGWLLVCLF